MLTYRNVCEDDVELLIKLYNAAFYEDFTEYGECPAYGRTKEQMLQSIRSYPKTIISYGGNDVGVISVKDNGQGVLFLGCLCVIPEYQHRGIGAAAMEWLERNRMNRHLIELITPADKGKNIDFYTRKCGYHIIGKMIDGNVEVVKLSKENNTTKCFFLQLFIKISHNNNIILQNTFELIRKM